MHCSPFRAPAAVLLVFLINSSHLFANAKTIPRIIDDTYGDQATGFMPIYYPQGDTIWQRNCSAQDGCLITPDPALAQNGTWTAATYRTSLEDMGLRLQFKGTAISVYFIIANNVGATSYVTATTEAKFTMDGVFKSKYIHEPTSRLGLQYNVEVYNETGLDDSLHVLEISTGKLDHEVYIAFDHAKYTCVAFSLSSSYER
ncbi:hypothetical protein L218DRAFT_869373 [Marasmius fiardii PR-910]|nr:hypothetical protein L218DRAFT_869373 [Marasmius fiardii PR-910]